MIFEKNEKILEMKESIQVDENLEKNEKNRQNEKQILMDSLNFKKFRTFMPLPKENSQESMKNTNSKLFVFSINR